MAPFWAPNSRAILHKGREHVEETVKAATHWEFNVVVSQSDTDANGVLLTMTDLRAKTVS
jgi:16S rRNA (guanine527-N7)-methyltransferase